MLTEGLRRMEADGTITRTVCPEVPPRAEYVLLEPGESMRPILDSVKERGNRCKEKRNG